MPITTRMPMFDQKVERVLQSLCAHQAGHFVVGRHFVSSIRNCTKGCANTTTEV